MTDFLSMPERWAPLRVVLPRHGCVFVVAAGSAETRIYMREIQRRNGDRLVRGIEITEASVIVTRLEVLAKPFGHLQIANSFAEFWRKLEPERRSNIGVLESVLVRKARA